MKYTSRSSLLTLGYTDTEIRRRIDSGKWRRLARGRYQTERSEPTTAERHHAFRTVVELSRFRSPEVMASHASAAALHGLPLHGVDLQRVELTRHGRNGARVTRRIRIRSSLVPLDDRTRVNGVQVTSIARTLVDLARHADRVSAIVAADHALREGLVTGTEVVAAVARMGSAPRLPTARRVLRLADGRSESVGETRQRLILEPRHPGLVSQANVYDSAGSFVGRVDGALIADGVVIEFDGREKYTKYRRPGESIGNAVAREKRREDALRTLGWIVVRFVWADLANPAAMQRAVEAALRTRAGQPKPTGTAVPEDPNLIRF